MGILSDFYTGRLAPFENFTCSDIPQVVDLHEQVKRTESELLKTLSEEQQVAYQKIREYPPLSSWKKCSSTPTK